MNYPLLNYQYSLEKRTNVFSYCWQFFRENQPCQCSYAFDPVDPFSLLLPLSADKFWPNVQNRNFISIVKDIGRHAVLRFGLAAKLGAAELLPPRVFQERSLFSTAKDREAADIVALPFLLVKPHSCLRLAGAVCKMLLSFEPVDDFFERDACY